MNNGVHYTPTEQKLLDFLSDGQLHKPDEVLRACFDELADARSMQMAISNLRIKLRLIGEDIVAQSYGRRIMYMRVRLLRVSTDDT